MTFHSQHMKLSFGTMLLMVVFAAVTPFRSSAQLYRLSPQSQILIEGTSSVNSFTCYANDLSVAQEGSSPLKVVDLSTRALEIRIPVSSLDCHNGKMNKDLTKALKGETYPEILFSVTEMIVAKATLESPQSVEILVTGSLELAGHQRDISFPVSGFIDEDNRSRAVGSVDLLMTSFNIEPPKALFGLIKARDEITIRFRLAADFVDAPDLKIAR